MGRSELPHERDAARRSFSRGIDGIEDVSAGTFNQRRREYAKRVRARLRNVGELGMPGEEAPPADSPPEGPPDPPPTTIQLPVPDGPRVGRPRTLFLRCVELDLTFDGLAAVQEFCQTNSTKVLNALRTGRPWHGYHWTTAEPRKAAA